jgi:hypothetical protein
MKTSLDESWVNWKDCLARDDDFNPIFNQLRLMVWDTAIYRVILKGRELRWEENPEKPRVNAELHNFIDRNYFQSQCATVRRLVDNTKKSKIYGDYGVYSIGALIKDIENHHSELTRSAFLELHEMPYDYSDVQKRKWEFIFARFFDENGTIIPRDLDWQRIEDAHVQFDRMSGVSQEKRSPDDRIKQSVFDGLRAQLSKCDPVVKHVDKFIAHSSTPESRSKILDSRITFSQVWEAQRILYEIANFLRASLFLVDTMLLAVESYSFYSHWDQPLFHEDEKDRIYEVYKKYEKETDDWRVNSVENMWKVIEEL